MEEHVSPWVLLIMSAAIAFILALLSVLVTRRLRKIPETRAQGMVELIVSALNNFVTGIVGPGGEKYTPFIGTLFLYILAMNLLGLVPGMSSPTGNLSITLALAIVVFIMYNYWGIKSVGAANYFKHLIGEPVWLAPLMLPIHIIGELARPISLSIRLFGNVFGKEIVMMVFATLAASSIYLSYLRYHGVPLITVPLQLPLMIFAVFIAFVQALVFSLLSCIYIAIAVSGHEEAHE